MKALFLTKHGNSSDAFEQREMPDVMPTSHQVQIDVEGFGINFADVLARKGLYPDMPPLPCVLGYEVVGRISMLGKEVRGLAIGTRVVAFTRFGGYASKACTDYRAVVEMGEEMPAGEALALATQYSTAYYCMFEAIRLHIGDKVLVHSAAGGVGIALCQLAKHLGCEVYATAGSESKLEFLRSQGIHHVFNYSYPDYADRIKTALKGARLDATFNAIAGKSIKSDYALLGSGGRLVIFGAASRVGGGKGIISGLNLLFQSGFFTPLKLLMASKSLVGVNILRISDNKPEILASCMASVVALAKAGTVKPHVFKEFGVQELSKAHDALENRSTIGKVAVVF